jgi:hypothetical protein
VFLSMIDRKATLNDSSKNPQKKPPPKRGFLKEFPLLGSTNFSR